MAKVIMDSDIELEVRDIIRKVTQEYTEVEIKIIEYFEQTFCDTDYIDCIIP